MIALTLLCTVYLTQSHQRLLTPSGPDWLSSNRGGPGPAWRGRVTVAA